MGETERLGTVDARFVLFTGQKGPQSWKDWNMPGARAPGAGGRNRIAGREDISGREAKVHQKGPGDLCGWTFQPQMIKLGQEECT